MIIYLITNKINNKKYVGQTTKSLAERWQNHIGKSRSGTVSQPIARAIKKYGKINFSIEKIAEANTKEELNTLEEKLIRELGTLVPDGYNIAPGGDNREISDYHRKRISEGIKNSPKSKAAHKRACGEGHPMHKLCLLDVKTIRDRFINSGDSSYALAKAYGLTQPNIMSIIRGKTWKVSQGHNRY